MKIMIVDDDDGILNALGRYLHREKCSVFKALDADTAFAELRNEKYDAIVSDYKMPGTNGLDLLERCAKEWPTMIRIMLTGEATLDLVIDAINHGHVNRFFVKPVAAPALLAGLHREVEYAQALKAVTVLYQRHQQQEHLINRLVNEYPDIADVDRDNRGAIVLDPLEPEVVSFANNIDLLNQKIRQDLLESTD